MTAYFYDGGANTGQTFAWYLLKGDFTKHHVVCFEPSPRNLSALAETCRAMQGRFASVRIVPAALGSMGMSGLNPFYEGKTPMGDSLLEARAGAKSLAIEVPTVSIADYLWRHTHPGDQVILKLDVEGAEGDVLEDVLENGPMDRLQQVLVEWHGIDPRQPALEARFASAGVPLERWPF